LLEIFGVTIGSHVTSIGSIEADIPNVLPEKLNESVDGSALRSLDTDATERMKKAIDDAKENGDTLGGVFEIVATGIPAGLGSYVTYDSKLDGRLAGAVMSIQAIKGVEIGAGFSGSFKPGSEVHDPIVADEKATNAGGIGRESNRAGGLEGGVTTGSPIVVKAAMKPISTLRKRLPSIDMRDGSVADAAVERSDVCAVPAAAIVGEAMVALVLADAFLEKFGGDSIAEITRNHNSYLQHLEKRGYSER
jgi:chorismate synthase